MPLDNPNRSHIIGRKKYDSECALTCKIKVIPTSVGICKDLSRTGTILATVVETSRLAPSLSLMCCPLHHQVFIGSRGLGEDGSMHCIIDGSISFSNDVDERRATFSSCGVLVPY